MSGEWVAEAIKAAVLVVLGGGSVSGYIAWRKDARTAPAESGNALKQLYELYEGSVLAAASALAESQALKARVETLERSDQTKSGQLENLHAQLLAVVEDRDGVVAYLKTLWRWVINGSKPPPPAIPDNLHDVLPPDEYMWPRTYDDTDD